MEKPKPLKQLASPNSAIPKWKPVNVIDLNQTALLSFLREEVRRQGKPAIAVPSLDKLPSVIDTLITAVRNGELDQQLAQASKLATARKPKRAA